MRIFKKPEKEWFSGVISPQPGSRICYMSAGGTYRCTFVEIEKGNVWYVRFPLADNYVNVDSIERWRYLGKKP